MELHVRPTPGPFAGHTNVPFVHLTTRNRAWSMFPASSSDGRMMPAAVPKCAAVPFESSPSASGVPIGVRPPQLTFRTPPSEGRERACQKSYSQPDA